LQIWQQKLYRKNRMDIEFKNNTEKSNPELKKVITRASETELQTMLIEYVGEKVNPADDAVTVEMVIEVLTEEFPQLILALAEENWIRGYHQAFTDIEAAHEATLESATDGK